MNRVLCLLFGHRFTRHVPFPKEHQQSTWGTLINIFCERCNKRWDWK